MRNGPDWGRFFLDYTVFKAELAKEAEQAD